MLNIAPCAEALREIALEAGRHIMKVYAEDFEVRTKDDASPLTEADLASHRTIIDGLAGLPGTPATLPVMSEEGRQIPWDEYRLWNDWWLIDPLDGTKEFIRKNGEFTVNIALMHREFPDGPGQPVAGWVYAPVPDLLFEGIVNQGALRISDAGSKTPGLPLPLPSEPPGPAVRIVASRSHRNPETDAVIDAVSTVRKVGDIVSSGSSLKLCRIAEGSAELYPRCAPTMEWDTAAADAVCRAAGSFVVQARTGEKLEYGKNNLLNPWFLVSSDRELLKLSTAALNGIPSQGP